MSTPRKLAYLALGALFVILGLVGLIIPVIPGILFLLAAVYVVSKASSRVRRFAHSDPRIREAHRRFDRFGRLGILDRLRLAGWMTLDAGLRTTEALVTGSVRLYRGVKRLVVGQPT